MEEPIVGEIRLFASPFEPSGWLFCQGQVLPIADFGLLYQVMGNTFGGDGTTTFAVPDLRGRIPVHQGGAFVLGRGGGLEEVTLAPAELPAHSHPLFGSAQPAASSAIEEGVFARAEAVAYASEFTPQALAPQSVSYIGGGESHSNLQPFECINYIISLWGRLPPSN